MKKSEKESEYKGAKFYKCALQVNSFKYNTYRGGKAHDEEEYNQAILKRCQENKINVVGLADHGNVEISESLRQVLTEGGITVFPGFEIASSEKIHMVCLYDEECQVSKLNQNLGQLMEANSDKLESDPVHPSSLSCEKIAETIKSQKGFWFAAHATGNNGILRLSGNGDNYHHLWKKEELVSAIQIPVSVNEMENKYLEIIKNKNPDYKRNKPIAIINAKDVAKPEDLDIPTASCLVKMGQPSFASFKKAFFDAESRLRLNHEQPRETLTHILFIKWEGAGWFRDSKIVFSKHLNAIIGGRGTGKSALIESIRYVLDLPTPNNEQQNIDGLKKKVLENSTVTIKIRSSAQHGQEYTIRRRYGEASVVLNDKDEVSHLSIEDLLPNIKLMGQNEILQLEKDEKAKLDLVYNLIDDRGKDTGYTNQLEHLKQQLSTNRTHLITLDDQKENLKAQSNKLGGLQEKLKIYQKSEIEKKLKNVKLLQREKTIKKQIDEQYKELEQWLEQYRNVFDLAFLDATDIEKLPSKESIYEIKNSLTELKQKIGGFHQQAKQKFNNYKQKYETSLKKWGELHKTLNKEIDEAMKQIPDSEGKSGVVIGQEYQQISSDINKAQQAKNELEKKKETYQKLNIERVTFLEKYRETASQRFYNLKNSLNPINKKLKNKLLVKAHSKRGKKELKEFLQQLSGVGSNKLQWIDETDEIDLLQWAEWIEKENRDDFLKSYKKHGLTDGTVRSLCNMTLKQRLQLQEIALEDMVEVELNTAHSQAEPHFAPLKKLSTGQKCTAILNLMLLDEGTPLIIDQPEDHLDNAFIAEHIVQDLRRYKTQRQFIFATHNANIPVFGDAELIAVLEGGESGDKISEGFLDDDDIKEKSAYTLEGGEAAFSARKEKYGF